MDGFTLLLIFSLFYILYNALLMIPCLRVPPNPLKGEKKMTIIKKLSVLLVVEILILLGFSLSVFAQEPIPPHEYCTQIAQASEYAAGSKYQGIPLPKIMDMVQGDAVMESIVLMAYKIPDHQSKEDQIKEMIKLGNRIYSGCIAEVSGNRHARKERI